MKKIFYDINNNLKSIWWVAIFFIMLASLLLQSIIIAEKYSLSISLGFQTLLIFMVTIICQLIIKERLSKVLGSLNVFWLKNFMRGALWGTLLMAVPAIILYLLGYLEFQINNFSLTTILSGVVTFIGVAIAEELLFRGFIFRRLMDSFGEWPTQIIIAALFLLTHLNNPNMNGTIKILASVNIFIASILFGITLIKTNSLALPIGLHFMANFTQGTVLGFGVSGEDQQSLLAPTLNECPVWLSGGAFGLEASILGLITVITFTVFFYKSKTSK